MGRIVQETCRKRQLGCPKVCNTATIGVFYMKLKKYISGKAVEQIDFDLDSVESCPASAVAGCYLRRVNDRGEISACTTWATSNGNSIGQVTRYMRESKEKPVSIMAFLSMSETSSATRMETVIGSHWKNLTLLEEMECCSRGAKLPLFRRNVRLIREASLSVSENHLSGSLTILLKRGGRR